MSETHRPTPEAEKPKTPQEILTSLGVNFNYCWDVMGEAGDFSSLPVKLIDVTKIEDEVMDKKTKKMKKEVTVKKTLNEAKFLETLKKIHPVYLEHAKELFEADFANTPKIEAKHVTKEQEQQRNDYVSKITQSFIERVEFFSRLNPPEKVITGGKTRDQLIAEMAQNHIYISNYPRQMMENEAFVTTENPEQVDFVRLKVGDLFNDKITHTTDEIYAKATEKLGLKFCESQDGPNYLLHLTSQPMRENLRIGMKQISYPGGVPSVFELGADGGGGVGLAGSMAAPYVHWNHAVWFVFRLRIPETNKTEKILV